MRIVLALCIIAAAGALTAGSRWNAGVAWLVLACSMILGADLSCHLVKQSHCAPVAGEVSREQAKEWRP